MKTKMTDDLKKYYEDRFKMMESAGWHDLIEDVKTMHAATNNIVSINDEKTLHFKRGELSIMNWLLTLEDMSRAVVAQKEDEWRGS